MLIQLIQYTQIQNVLIFHYMLYVKIKLLVYQLKFGSKKNHTLNFNNENYD